MLVVWGVRLRGRQKLSDEALGNGWKRICGGGNCAQIDTQGIGLLDVTSAFQGGDIAASREQVLAERDQNDGEDDDSQRQPLYGG